jgi:hypothetical protein
MKYEYNKVIQQQYGQGWEDVSEYSCNSLGETKETHTTSEGKVIKLITHDFKEYRLTGYATRIILRKTKINN